MYMAAKAAGAKNIKSPEDIMRIPVIDGGEAGNIRHHLIERLRKFNEQNGRKDT